MPTAGNLEKSRADSWLSKEAVSELAAIAAGKIRQPLADLYGPGGRAVNSNSQ